MKDFTKENGWVHDMVMACRQDPNSADINGVVLYHIIELIRQDEREACAKACDVRSHRDNDMGAILARLIRARKETT